MTNKDKYYLLYKIFRSNEFKILRLLSFTVLFVLFFLFWGYEKLLIPVIYCFGILITQEIFILKKLGDNSVFGVSSNEVASRELLVNKLRFIVESKKEKSLIEELEKDYGVIFLKQLLGTHNIKGNSIPDQALFDEALSLIKKVNSQKITTLDVYAAYLILADVNEKVLFNLGLTPDDVLVVLIWARKELGIERNDDDFLKFTGSGAFDFFVYGWSAELVRYAVNLTSEVLSSINPQIIGREKEYELLITALSRSSSSNALVIGDAGIGKTTLVKKFIVDSNQGILPSQVSNKVVFKLLPEKLMASLKTQGELEERLSLLFEELLHAGNIVVYIPNIENMFGGGGMDLDASAVMMEYLTSSNIKIIGSLNESSYQNYISQKQELKSLFDVIKIQEPDPHMNIVMVMENAKKLSSENGILISYMAIKEVCKLSLSYLNDGTALPGRAIKLLEDVIAYCKTHNIKEVTHVEVRRLVESKVNIVLDKPSEEESKTLLNLESEIHKRIVSQDEAVSAISNAMRRVRSGMKNEKRPIASFLFLGPTGVGKTETAKALAFTYFGDENSMIRIDMSEYQRQESIERFLGATQNENYEKTVLDSIAEKPFSLILMDEFEKAHPQVIDLFLQVFDEGRLTDNRGRTVSFRDAIIIATSNAGSEFIREKYKLGKMVTDFKQELIDQILSKNIFKPELVNRFDDVVVFKPLDQKEAVNVSRLFLDSIIKGLREKQIEIVYDENIPEFIAQNSYSIEFGARNIRRYIEQSVENQLSKRILSDGSSNARNYKLKIMNNELVVE